MRRRRGGLQVQARQERAPARAQASQRGAPGEALRVGLRARLRTRAAPRGEHDGEASGRRRVAVDARLRLLAAATWRWRFVAAELALSVVSAASAARLVQLSLRARRTTIRRLLRLWKVVHVKFAFCAWAAVCELETARSRAILRAWVTFRRRTLVRGWARWSDVDAELRKDAWEQLQAPRLHGLVGSRRHQVRALMWPHTSFPCAHRLLRSH